MFEGVRPNLMDTGPNCISLRSLPLVQLSDVGDHHKTNHTDYLKSHIANL
jgi:hypothetical protein